VTPHHFQPLYVSGIVWAGIKDRPSEFRKPRHMTLRTEVLKNWNMKVLCVLIYLAHQLWYIHHMRYMDAVDKCVYYSTECSSRMWWKYILYLVL